MARERQTKPKPKIKNIVWRSEVAHARYRYKGETYTRSLETGIPGDAKERLADFIKEIKAGRKTRGYVEATVVMKGRVFPRLRKSTQDRYGTSLLNLFDAFHAKDVGSITIGNIADYHAARTTVGASNASIKHDLEVLSILLGTCIDDDIITANVARLYIQRATKAKQLKLTQKDRVLGHDEQPLLVKAILGRKANVYYNATVARIALFLVATGLRITEALTLTWDQISEKANELTLDDVLGQDDEDEDIRTKSGHGRRIPMLPMAWDAIDEIKRTPGLVFCHEDGTALDRTVVYHSISSAGRKAGFKRAISPHDLRRTCGCRLLRGEFEGIKKLTMQEVSLWLGHSSIKVTEEVYAWINADALHAAVK